MPELPEVECLTRGLREIVEGEVVRAATFLRKDIRSTIPTRKFEEIVVGRKIKRVWRRSKYILWETDIGYGIFHLGMTGNMLRRPAADLAEKHTHAVFEIGAGSHFLHFIDPRRFGQITCCLKKEFESFQLFRNLGPEPLAINDLAEHLFAESRNRKSPIKSFIMDARRIVGVGNIYASEALFRARINPLRAAGSISRGRIVRLADAIQETLREAITVGGTSFRDYKSAKGEPGYFQLKLKVYDRKNQPCNVCDRPIREERLSGRSTFFCKKCQT